MLFILQNLDHKRYPGGHALVMKFKRSIKHPGGTDLIFYPQLIGLPSEPTVDEIVDLAMKGI